MKTPVPPIKAGQGIQKPGEARYNFPTPWLIHPLKREESYINATQEMSPARAPVSALEGLAEPVAWDDFPPG